MYSETQPNNDPDNGSQGHGDIPPVPPQLVLLEDVDEFQNVSDPAEKKEGEEVSGESSDPVEKKEGEQNGSVVPPASITPTKKAKAPARSTEQKVVDDLEVEKQKINEKLAVARLNLTASHRRIQLNAGRDVMHESMLSSERKTREQIVALLQPRVDEAKQKTLVEYLMAITSIPAKVVEDKPK